jgi:hypothetical protein
LDQHDQSEEKEKGIQIRIGALSTRQWMNKRGIDEIPTVNAASPYVMPFSSLRSSLSVSPVVITKGSIGQERRETCKQAEEKIHVGMVANSCSASARLHAAKGR